MKTFVDSELSMERYDTLNILLEKYKDNEGITNLCYTVIQDKRIILQNDTDIPSSINLLRNSAKIFPIGTLSQSFIVVAILQLYGQNKFDLNDPITYYLKALPDSWKNVTIYQLLEHSSGIPDYITDCKLVKNNKREKIITHLRLLPLLFPPGSRIQPCATNYMLLTMLIEQLSNMSYQTFITEYQLQPLTLSEIQFLNDIKGTEQSDELHDIPILSGFNDMISSSDNLARWMDGIDILLDDERLSSCLWNPKNLLAKQSSCGFGGWSFFSSQESSIESLCCDVASTIYKYEEPNGTSTIVAIIASNTKSYITEIAQLLMNFVTNESVDMIERFETEISLKSIFSFDETCKRFEDELIREHQHLFIRIDHTFAAKEVGLLLPPTVVYVFGNPQVGTLLMQNEQSFALNLPLKVLIWEDHSQQTYLNCLKPSEIARSYRIYQNPILQQMDKLCKRLIRSASRIDNLLLFIKNGF